MSFSNEIPPKCILNFLGEVAHIRFRGRVEGELMWGKLDISGDDR